MRAQALMDSYPEITIEEQEGVMIPIVDIEVKHCAAVIVATFLNPSKQNQNGIENYSDHSASIAELEWDFDRFIESKKKTGGSRKIFYRSQLGLVHKASNHHWRAWQNIDVVSSWSSTSSLSGVLCNLYPKSVVFADLYNSKS